MRASAPNIFAGDKQLATREFVLSLFKKIDDRFDTIVDPSRYCHYISFTYNYYF